MPLAECHARELRGIAFVPQAQIFANVGEVILPAGILVSAQTQKIDNMGRVKTEMASQDCRVKRGILNQDCASFKMPAVLSPQPINPLNYCLQANVKIGIGAMILKRLSDQGEPATEYLESLVCDVFNRGQCPRLVAHAIIRVEVGLEVDYNNRTRIMTLRQDGPPARHLGTGQGHWIPEAGIMLSVSERRFPMNHSRAEW
jgi:hypothetical protein